MILITGASGSIGQHLVRQLREGGHRFKALVRSSEKGRALDCEYVVGDFDAPETIRSALANVDQVFLNSTPAPALVAQQTTVIDLAKAAGVARIVKVSTFGASAESRLNIGRWHGAVEAQLTASGLPWFSLQPSTFMENLLRSAEGVRRNGALYAAYKDGRVVFVHAEDVAASGAALLTGPQRKSSSYVITGNEALTYSEVAAKLSAKLGKKVRYVDVPVEQIVAKAKANGNPPELAEDFGVMMTLIAEGRSMMKPSTAVKELTGREPRTLDQFIDEHSDAFR